MQVVLALSLVIIYPGWSWAIQGQPYVDRFYLPFSLLLFYLVNKYKNINIIIIITIIISSLIAEKTIIYNSIFLMSYLILNYKNISTENRKKFLILGFILALAFYALTKFYINNLYYSSAIPKDLNTLLNIFNSENFMNGIFSLILTSAPLLIPALIFQRRLFLNSLIMLGPNIIGDIGGAEKIGFSTHYHSLYFGYLIFPYLMSIGYLYKNFIRTSYFYILIFDILYFSIDYGDKNKIKFNLPINSQGNFVSSFFNDYKTLTNKQIGMDVIRKNIPINSTISTTEAGMPFLYSYKNLYFYPLNIGISDYLILNYYIDNNIKFSGYYGHLGNIHNAMVDQCLMAKYSHLYDFDNSVKINNYLALIKRK